MADELSKLRPPHGATKKRKRVGRGDGSGHGGTSGKGHKGHKARSGGGGSRGFEGGQMPMQRRLPKRGFHNPFRKVYSIVNLSQLEVFESGSQVDAQSLLSRGIIRKVLDGVKILGEGNLTKPLNVKVEKVSAAARDKIVKAGGSLTTS